MYVESLSSYPISYKSSRDARKFSKIVINGSILKSVCATESLDNYIHFQEEEKKSKMVAKNFLWAVKKWPKRQLLSLLWQDSTLYNKGAFSDGKRKKL